MGSEKPPILHIIVVGFHHKLGCQVEFSHPPLIAGTAGQRECPSGWKYMPTLALPDGSHNFEEDTVFFNLPSLMEPTESVYGISCYRQIPVEKLKNRTADVTRSTVQKSVCVLSRLPIYGYIEVKLALIADAFFEQGDFEHTDLLVKAYQQLNACLLDDESRRSLRHFHVNVSLREIVLHWRHKTLILFKLFLLQRRVVFFASPVRGMCALILGIASLIPRLLEKGWQEVACVRTSRPLSPMPDFTAALQQGNEREDSSSRPDPEETSAKDEETVAKDEETAAKDEETSTKDEKETDIQGVAVVEDEAAEVEEKRESSSDEIDADGCVVLAAASPLSGSGDSSPNAVRHSTSQSTRELNRFDSSESSEVGSGGKRSNSLTRESSVDTLASNLAALAAVNPDEYRAPISIFASGNLCLPYLSLPYMDLLGDPSVLSYIIGTSNFLFQQKRQLSDILVDAENASMETHDQELRRQLQLSVEDLRFMDYVMKHVQAPKEDGEGGECWIRDQFQGYILALLRTSVSAELAPKEFEHFNVHFMHAFRRTQCYQEWHDVKPDADFFDSLPGGHPFAGTLSVADVKLKFAQTMQNSESGRKINQAVNSTSRAVGGAISQAKGALTTWWSSITTAPTIPAEPSTSPHGGDERPLPEGFGEEQPDITVAFQKRKGEIVEEVVSIHMDTSSSLAAAAAAREEGDGTSSGSDKPVDSAEELEEESAAPTAQGIVEIGREAEILDKASALVPEMHSAAEAPCGSSNSSSHRGEIFIA